MLIPLFGYLACAVPVPITSSVGLYLAQKVLREVREQPYASGKSLALVGLVVSAGTLGTWLVAAAAWLFLWLRAS